MPAPLDPDDLDTGTLALFVGSAAASAVQDHLTACGFDGLRMSHGYLFQHLIDGSPTIRDLAAALDMTQQGASKAVAELERLGYAERRPDPQDARIRRVALTPRGHEAVDAARRARAEMEERLRERLGAHGLDTARSLLGDLLDEFGGSEAVRRRRVRPPR
ncbi:MarR family winged helix-turn-helix transcriptional regulator [Nocardiopsis aegyptia]|uniref:DNA-binding MarR family transcriptional regulator n=1 Tax=Nocardiopsis aegyptia TaxID=220378 RepID=A0A7Z0EJ85_9ACTN|nr:MarR family winged helix-turn-helix transcriptional regulator [Nocardiopsis aegyptia]NYJ32230.1 DNA-binding MarR family transcriptional regulator [Nocardiopsis aegyptia]